MNHNNIETNNINYVINYALYVFDFFESAIKSESISRLNKSFSVLTNKFGVDFWVFAKADKSGAILPNSTQMLYGGKASAWHHVYISNELYLADPILNYGVENRHAVRWGEVLARRSITKAQELVMAQAAEFGFRDGVLIPFRGFDDTTRLVSMGGEKIDPSPQALDALAMAAQFYGIHAHRLLPQTCAESESGIIKVLTTRQREILAMCRQGLRAHEIAVKLGISIKAVEDSLSHSRAKFNARSTAQLIADAIICGELD